MTQPEGLIVAAGRARAAEVQARLDQLLLRSLDLERLVCSVPLPRSVEHGASGAGGAERRATTTTDAVVAAQPAAGQKVIAIVYGPEAPLQPSANTCTTPAPLAAAPAKREGPNDAQ